MSAQPVAEQDEYFLDSITIRRFIADVRRIISEQSDVEAALDALHPRFAALLADQSWLPAEFAAPYEASGMGGGIASWLLFRAGDRSLSLISLVVPTGAETPVHDHLAWGFVGLYRGEQRETVYQRQDDLRDALADGDGDATLQHASLTVTQVNELKAGDFYRLVPPDGDIHAVKTTSPEASISIHLLTNDIGCVLRHAYDPEQSNARPFRSGYSNVACTDSEP